MDILHVALMCSVPNFTGDRGHRISAASAKMVSSGVKLEFTILALWCFDKMECSHL